MTDDVRKHCEFGGMAGPVAEIMGMPKLRTACLVATRGRFEQMRQGTIDAGQLPHSNGSVWGIPVYTCDNDVDVMLRALELAKTTDEVWMAMDAGDQLVRMPSWIRDLHQQKGGDDMSKTPTAEEVLGLYLKWNKTEEEFDEFRMQCRDEGEVHDFAMDVISDKEKFEATLCEWQSAQGPVTREWFVERFGGVYVTCARADIAYWEHDNSMDLIYRSDSEPTLEQENPTRSDIETLVRVLGGECNGKDA